MINWSILINWKPKQDSVVTTVQIFLPEKKSSNYNIQKRNIGKPRQFDELFFFSLKFRYSSRVILLNPPDSLSNQEHLKVAVLENWLILSGILTPDLFLLSFAALLIFKIVKQNF